MVELLRRLWETLVVGDFGTTVDFYWFSVHIDEFLGLQHFGWFISLEDLVYVHFVYYLLMESFSVTERRENDWLVSWFRENLTE